MNPAANKTYCRARYYRLRKAGVCTLCAEEPCLPTSGLGKRCEEKRKARYVSKARVLVEA